MGFGEKMVLAGLLIGLMSVVFIAIGLHDIVYR